MKRMLIAVILICSVLYAFGGEGSGNMSEEKITLDKSHKKFAIELNNLVWDLLEKADRSVDEDSMMINAAHASLYHWSRVGTELNLQRGEWMCSHAYAVLGRGEPALYHAKRCMMYTEKNGYKDFDLGYAYEAMARAHAAAGEMKEAKDFYNRAVKAGEGIKGDEDRKIFTGDLKNGPWYGVDKRD